MLSADTSRLGDREDLLRLWSHENLRVFADRLVDKQDRLWFNALLSRVLQTHFKVHAAITLHVLACYDFNRALFTHVCCGIDLLCLGLDHTGWFDAGEWVAPLHGLCGSAPARGRRFATVCAGA